MQEINGFKVSDSVFEQLSFRKEPERKASDALGQAEFMQLLIAQLKNQDPLSPQEGAEFVAQLAQFSTVQGVENLNKNFVSMNNSLKSNQAIQASALVGHTVLVDGSRARLAQGGEISGLVTIDEATDDTVLNFYDARGLLVRQEALGPQSPGEISFAWDGRAASGESLPPGLYTVEAVGVREGETFGLPTTLAANVNSVTIGADGELTLNVDGVGALALSAIREIL